MAPSVLVFGATGGVGSACARHAHSLGASVTLAVRDLNKPVPGLSADEEKAGGYKRVKADLTDPASLTAAVAASGAKAAFVYLVFTRPGSADANKPAAEALKAAGVEFVVFLSSFSVEIFEPTIDKIPPQEFIPAQHAQVELMLKEVFGPERYVAVRPAGFASNLFRNAKAIKSGTVKVAYPNAKFDWIVPEDIGRASATILVGGISSTGGKNSVLLAGPQATGQGDAIKTIGKVTGKEVNVVEVSDEEGIKEMAAEGLPEPVARYLVGTLKNGFQGGNMSIEDFFTSRAYNLAVENVRKYAGKATTLEEWVADNKQAFL